MTSMYFLAGRTTGNLSRVSVFHFRGEIIGGYFPISTF